MASFKNTFSWSASRDRLFRSCHRAYYYNYYGYWNGWSYDADPKTKLIYKLKKLQSTTLWAGSTVHDILQDILTMIKAIATGASEPETYGNLLSVKNTCRVFIILKLLNIPIHVKQKL